MNQENSRQPIFFDRPSETPPLGTLRGVNRAAYTLFVTPSHDTLHKDVAEQTRHETQPLQPEIEDVAKGVAALLQTRADAMRQRSLKGKELAKLGGVLIQFTDYVPTLQPYSETPFSEVDALYNSVVTRAAETGPLTFVDQLGLALEQTRGDVPEALWRLFMTSRLHARWLDGEVITDAPSLSRDEKVARMETWQSAIAGCKPNSPEMTQDANGDTYYAWTHALAYVAFDALPTRPTRRTRAAARTFQNGTRIMHGLAHRVNPQTVVNDHSIAADYGNAIGAACSEFLKK